MFSRQAMPPNNTPNGSSQQPAAWKRSLAGASRVAIPLPLSRPRPAKTQPKPEVDAAVQAPAKQVVAEEVQKESADTAPAAEQDGNVVEEAGAVPGSVTPAASEKNARIPPAETPVSRGSTAMSVSDGPAPEPKTLVEPTPPPAAAAVKLASPAPAPTTRKPSQIRTELPPAFVPSAAQHTPTSSLQMNRNSQAFHPQSHPSRPSTSSIVFGGEDSSASSPAPPQSAGSAFMPPPSFPVQRQPPPFVPTNHAHHFSEPQPYQNYPPGYGPQQPQSTGQRPFYPTQQHQSFQPHNHTNFRYPPREPFVSADAPQTNGHAAVSRPASPNGVQALRSPTAGERPTGESRMQGLRQQQFGRQMPPPQGSPDFRSELDNAQVLRDHIRSSFASPMLADCHLQITLESDASKQYIDAHKLVLARSPTLLELIQCSAEPTAASLKTQVHIALKGKYLGLRSFSECLRYLYGGPLIQFDLASRQHPAAESGPTNEDRMRYAIEHIATGVWLKMPVIAMRGVAVAGSLMHWDTIPLALGFALEGGLSPVWTVDDGSSEDRGSTTSSDDSIARAEAAQTPTFDPHATQLLHGIFHFVVSMFPPNFYPDTSAPQLASSPRLPPFPAQNHEKGKASRSDPRLSKLKFGDLPAEEPPRPSATTTTISSLLFSLPFPLLKFLLEHPILADRLGPETVGSIMRQVVVEREARRSRAVKARAAAPNAMADGVETRVLSNLHWEESVEVTGHGRLGLRLARRKQGVDTPPSAGAAEG